MRAGARTPEQLETLFEDAFLLRDREALIQLFHDDAVLIGWGPRYGEPRRSHAQAAAMWERDYTHLAEPRRVLQTRDTALVVAERGINVVRRGTDESWRYAIALLDVDQTNEWKQP